MGAPWVERERVLGQSRPVMECGGAKFLEVCLRFVACNVCCLLCAKISSALSAARPADCVHIDT